ncbi:MAG: cytochrome c maturation protein CcmE [Asticcacaulis sp.]
MGFWPRSVKARRRLIIFLIAAPVLAGAVALSLYALKGTVVYFYTPAQWVEARVDTGQTVRLGGLVKPASIVKTSDGTTHFVVQDKLDEIAVSYRGELPDLFREGQGVVCEGKVTGEKRLMATQVLAKHDEKYMPKNVEKALKEQGEWRPESGMDKPKPTQRPFQ